MIIDGEKWACEACVRGHRVSNCQHSDRPLQHINKKGRPVSQCQHCRSMRKSRASHVKCDCGEKSHKCAHLKTTVEGHRDSCCCNHGGRCTCSHKKEPQLDPVPESDSDDHETTASASATTGCGGKNATVAKPTTAKGGAVRSRRRANTIHSDGALTFDENGRHKPTYKHVKASSKCEPYSLKRVNSVHSASSLPSRSPADSPRATAYGSDSTGLDSSAAAVAARRAAKSETTSPLLIGGTSSFSQLNGQLPPLDLSGIEYPRYIPGSSGFDLFAGGLPDPEGPIFSAGLSAPPVDWSHYDGLDFGRGGGDPFTPSSFGHPQGYGSAGGAFDFSGSEQAPTMTTATSGDVSEVEDFMGPSADDFDVSSAFGTATSGYGSLLGGAGSASGADLNALDYEDFNTVPKAQAAVGSVEGPTKLYSATVADEASLAAPAGAAFTDDPLFWMNDYSHGLTVVDNTATDPSALFWETR